MNTAVTNMIFEATALATKDNNIRGAIGLLKSIGVQMKHIAHQRGAV